MDIELTKNYHISRIIKGGWQLAGGHGKVDKKTAVEDMFRFVESGINTFDCADIYLGVEDLIGKFLKEYKLVYGEKKCEVIKIHTKFVPDLDELDNLSYAYVQKIIDRSLKRLGRDSLDLVQLHWWDFEKPGYIEASNYLLKLKEKGKIKNIGTTNFDTYHLREIIDSGVNSISNQVQYSLVDMRPRNSLTSYCKQNNKSIICYGVLAGGFISDKYLGMKEAEVILENRSLIKYKLIVEEFGGWELFQELLKILNLVASKHKVSISTVACAYILRQPEVKAIIIGARDASHLEDILEIKKVVLDNEDKYLISNIITRAHGPKGDIYSVERIKNGKHAEIMKYNLNKV